MINTSTTPIPIAPFPITDFVNAALRKNNLSRIPFTEQNDGSYTSGIFIASDEIFETIRNALSAYGITATIVHDRTHKNARRIGLQVTAEQMGAAAERYTQQVIERLNNATGATWHYEPERRSFMSDFCDSSAARTLQDALVRNGLRDSQMVSAGEDDQRNERKFLKKIAAEKGLAVTDESWVAEVAQSYVGVWMANPSKAEEVGQRDQRRGKGELGLG